MAQEGFSISEPQALLELLAARCMTNQRNVLVILTDVTTKAVAFAVDYDAVLKYLIFSIKLTILVTNGQFVSSFLADS